MSRRIPTASTPIALLLCMRTEFADGAWTVHQIFAGLTLEKYPALVPEIHIFISVARGEADREQVNFTLTAPDGAVVSSGGMMMEFAPGQEVGEAGVAAESPDLPHCGDVQPAVVHGEGSVAPNGRLKCGRDSDPFRGETAPSTSAEPSGFPYVPIWRLLPINAMCISFYSKTMTILEI